jgi:hypothetical protein
MTKRKCRNEINGMNDFLWIKEAKHTEVTTVNKPNMMKAPRLPPRLVCGVPAKPTDPQKVHLSARCHANTSNKGVEYTNDLHIPVWMRVIGIVIFMGKNHDEGV